MIHMMYKKYLTLAVLLLLLLPGCAPTGNLPFVSQRDTTYKDLAELNHDGLKSYVSTFQIQFDGPKKWLYQLTTHKSGALRETNLHIEGIDKAKNPGDVRLVTDGKTSWMIGPGTDQECIQFPNNQGLDPTLVYPETLITTKEMANILSFRGEETVAGMPVRHYSSSGHKVGKWENSRVDVWQEPSSKALMRFIFQAAGEDTIFGTGAGNITARYEVSGTGDQKIEPVQGCEISAPLPDNVTKFVRLPGMVSYESAASTDDIRNFYQAKLAEGNWAEKEPPAQSEGVTILSYQRGSEELEIHIQENDGGSMVKLLFLQNK